MPLPEPRPTESMGDFIPRCMNDPKTLEEFPDNSQRFAVCMSQYNDIKAEINNETLYNDYPEAVVNNAKNVLDWVAVNGWGTCGTPVGKKRANDLSKKMGLSLDIIKRMYSYLSRHKIDLETSKSYEDGCGKLMFDAWGGLEALEWSEKKIKEIENINNKIKNEVKKISFDWNDVLNTPEGEQLAIEKINEGNIIYVITELREANNVKETAKKLGIPLNRVIFTGGFDKMDSIKKYGIQIHYDSNPETVKKINEQTDCEAIFVKFEK